MNDFQKTLETLKTTDLAFLVPQSDPAQPCGSKRRRRQSAVANKRADTADTTAVPANAPSPTESGKVAAQAVAEPTESHQADVAPRERPFGEHKLPAFLPPDKPPVAAPVAADATPAADSAMDAPRKRRHLEHEWPAVGAILSGTYFGTTYRAEVVAANKRLKSGKQLRLLDGPAKGRRLDSFTKALLVATARQRREGKLKRKSATNGWSFWTRETEPEAAS